VTHATPRLETLEDYRRLFDTLADMVYCSDEDGHVEFMNETLVRMLGYSRADMAVRSMAELAREDFRERVEQSHREQIEQRQPSSYIEFPLAAKDGSEVWIAQHASLVEDGGRVIGTQAVARDITARVRRDAANARTAMEDGSTRLLNRDAFALLGHQRIQENRRIDEPFFVLHVRLQSTEAALGEERIAQAMRALTWVLKGVIRGADALARLDDLHLAVLTPRGGVREAAAMRARVEAALSVSEGIREMNDFETRCETVIHNPKLIRSPEALMLFQWAAPASL
jgi:PAS domain S-box-containing protein